MRGGPLRSTLRLISLEGREVPSVSLAAIPDQELPANAPLYSDTTRDGPIAGLKLWVRVNNRSQNAFDFFDELLCFVECIFCDFFVQTRDHVVVAFFAFIFEVGKIASVFRLNAFRFNEMQMKKHFDTRVSTGI